MGRNEYTVWEILKQRTLVQHFGQVIADHLLHNPHTAGHLISHFLSAHEQGNSRLYFPSEFTQEMRSEVLLRFVESDDTRNYNYLRLLEDAKSSPELPASDGLRLKARKKREALQEKIFSHSSGMTYGANVTFKSIPDGSVEEAYSNNIFSCTYSREWIEENPDYPTLLNNFIYLFGYVDRYFRCVFVSLKSELGIFELIHGARGKDDYLGSAAFRAKQMLTLAQMASYNQELQRLDIRLEDIFKWFFEDYLRGEFGAENFSYNAPSVGTTYAEKCKLLAIAIDEVLKQYRLFCEDGHFNRELYEMSSGHIVFRDLNGAVTNKYAYSDSDDLRNEMFHLFSDQSLMNGIERSKRNYKSFVHLILSKKVKREDFADYQQRVLDWLIQRGSILVADDERLLINKARAKVLLDLYHHEVICPTYYSRNLRGQVDALIAAGELHYESTLFSRPEQDYLNYILNKSEFSNGLDLRNRYCHGTYTLDEKEQRNDYLELQKIMVLIIIKINEEFCIKAQCKQE